MDILEPLLPYRPGVVLAAKAARIYRSAHDVWMDSLGRHPRCDAVSIPFPAKVDKSGTFDLLVAVDPVWEISWLVRELPIERFEPGTAVRRIEDGGGSSLNTACALASAGRRVVAVGRVGDDREGRASIEALERRGVAARIEIVPGRTTKRNMLYVDERSGATAFQAVLPKEAADAWEEVPPGLHDAAWLLLDRLPGHAADWFRARRRAGLRNALSRHGQWREAATARRFRDALAFLDLLQLPERDRSPAASDREGRDRVARSEIHSPTAPLPLAGDEIAAILRAGVGMLVRTRGRHGVIVHRPGTEEIGFPAVATAVVDPTGAGDALTAGILDGLLSDVPIPEAVGRGLDWAARTCRHLGARGWLDEERMGG